MRWVIAAGLAAACSTPQLGPTSAAHADPRVRELPPEVTLIASVDVPALGAHPSVGGRLRAQDAFGVPGGLFGVDHVVIGCGPDGCVGLADGALDTLSLADGLPERGSVRARRDPRGPSERLRGPGGWTGRVDRLGDGKIVFGDARAVRALRASHRAGMPAADAGWLDGLVPEGPVWLAMRDVSALTDDASRWLGALELPEARRALDSLDAHQDALAHADAHVEALAVAVDPERERATVRARARTHPGAQHLELALRAKLSATATPDGVLAARVLRSGRLVELQLDLEPTALEARLADPGERR